ncbi:MAG: hypothetical protein ACXACF_06520 [Candidatus Hermodarchaeia archaeon]
MSPGNQGVFQVLKEVTLAGRTAVVWKNIAVENLLEMKLNRLKEFFIIFVEGLHN